MACLACEPPFRPLVAVGSVTIAPDSVAVRWGATQVLTATVRDSSGAILHDVAVTWTSSHPTQVAVTQTGVVQALQPGIAYVTAHARDVTGNARIVVFIPAASVALAMDEYALMPGTSWPLTTALRDSLGRPIFGRPHTWSSSDTSVFVVNAAGVITARATGSARVVVMTDGVADSAAIRVVAARFVSVRPGLGPHTCALAEDGRAFCWGANELGQLGNGEYTQVTGATAVAGSAHYVDLRGGGQFHCALTHSGALRCWGNGALGRLGTSSFASSAVPVPVASTRVFTTIATGWAHSCAQYGLVVTLCWGSGTGAIAPSPLVTGDSVLFNGVRAGDGFSCALQVGGQGWCWGRNLEGQLGDGSNAPSSIPVRVSGSLAFVTLSSGAAHSCGVTATGAAWCWGRNDAGQLGNANTAATGAPVGVAGGVVFSTVSAGLEHSCGLATSGEAWCWGGNSHGELGTGNTAASDIPVRAAPTLLFTELNAGGGHTCGVDSDGITWCWGRNQAGQLGDGTRADRPLPVRVAGQP